MEKPAPSSPAKQAGLALLVAVGCTVALRLLPSPWGFFVGWPLVLFSTYAHEMSHGVAALLVGGQFESFRMWADASGIAQTASRGGPLASAAISAGGLLGPAVAAAALFIAGCRPATARIGLAALGVLMLASDVLLVRNGFGLVFVGAAGALFVVLARALSAGRAQGLVLFLAVQLAITVFTRADYLFMAVARTSGGELPSDTAAIAKALGGSYLLWGVVVGAISLAVLWGGVSLFLRANAPRGDRGAA